jgi:hypothetical protein
MLTGWMDGDRHIGNSAVSISRELALNMFDIANVLGHNPTIGIHTKEKMGSDGVQHHTSWRVGWRPNKVGHYRFEATETHLWRAVQNVDRQPFNGYVYNLEVADDNSYVAEGIGVHNCWLHGPCRAVNAAWLLAMGHSHKLASNSLGEDFGWRVANGGDPSAAIEALVKNGAARWELCQPPMSRSHSQWKAGWQADRALHKALTGHLIDGMNGDTFAGRCVFAFRDIPSSVGYTRWSHEIFGAIKVIDLQQSSIEMLDDFGEAGGFCHVPREVVLNPKFLGAPRFQAVDWNQWGTDTEFPTNDWAPDIDLTGFLATSIPNQ